MKLRSKMAALCAGGLLTLGFSMTAFAAEPVITIFGQTPHE